MHRKVGEKVRALDNNGPAGSTRGKSQGGRREGPGSRAALELGMTEVVVLRNVATA